jgi:hypothetical protein
VSKKFALPVVANPIFEGTGEFEFIGPKGCFEEFRIKGHNPPDIRELGRDVVSAVFMCGFNVNNKPRWKMEDYIRQFSELRYAQLEQAGSKETVVASFVAQKGIWRSPKSGMGFDPKKDIEDACQIIVIGSEETPKAFEAQMKNLAGWLARDMRQEVILLELFMGGVLTGEYLAGWKSGDDDLAPFQ